MAKGKSKKKLHGIPGVPCARIQKQFKLLPETNQRIERLAAELGESQAEIVRRAIGQLYRSTVPDDAKSRHINRPELRSRVVPILEFAWGTGVLDVDDRQFAEIISALFPEAYDDQVEPEAMARKAVIDAERLAAMG